MSRRIGPDTLNYYITIHGANKTVETKIQHMLYAEIITVAILAVLLFVIVFSLANRILRNSTTSSHSAIHV